MINQQLKRKAIDRYSSSRNGLLYQHRAYGLPFAGVTKPTFSKLRSSVLVQVLPYGVWVTSSNHMFYFNRYYDVIFGVDLTIGEQIPVVHDMFINNIEETMYFYDSSMDITRYIADLRKPFEILFKIRTGDYSNKIDGVFRHSSHADGCFKYFNFNPLGYSKAITQYYLLMDALPYGYFESERYEVYHNREYEVIMVRDKKSNMLVPSKREMDKSRYLVDAEEISHHYIYRGSEYIDDLRILQRSISVYDSVLVQHEKNK